MYYLEDISAGKLLVLEHGRREGVNGGPEIVVEKEDVKDTVGTQILYIGTILLYGTGTQHAGRYPKLWIPCSRANLQVKHVG